MDLLKDFKEVSKKTSTAPFNGVLKKTFYIKKGQKWLLQL